MKIWAFSDLHLEYRGISDFWVPNADVCVAAGDITNNGIIPSLQWLADNVAAKMPVVFVPGNHEFYRSSIVESRILASDFVKNLPNVHLLDDDDVLIGDTLFVGATLWTDLKLRDDPDLAARLAKDKQTGMNDYKRIKYQKTPWMRFTPYLSARLHQQSKIKLCQGLQKEVSRKIVVTHHAPSQMSLPEDKISDAYAPMYASNLESLIEEYKPLAWFHGHIHSSNDYMIGDTRVISNPRGYGDSEEGTSFNPTLTVEV